MTHMPHAVFRFSLVDILLRTKEWAVCGGNTLEIDEL